MPDCEVGAHIKHFVNEKFEHDFMARSNDYVDGKVSCKKYRILLTSWIADAVADLYENHKGMIRGAFDKCGITIDMDGYDKYKISVPNFKTYQPPEKDEEHRTEPLTKEEIKKFEVEAYAFRKKQKEARKRK